MTKNVELPFFQEVALKFRSAPFPTTQIDNIEASAHCDELIERVHERFGDMMQSIADRFSWPFDFEDIEVAFIDELEAREDGFDYGYGYVPIGSLPRASDAAVVPFELRMGELMRWVSAQAAALVAETAPRAELAAAINDDPDPRIRYAAAFVLHGPESAEPLRHPWRTERSDA